MRKLTLKIYFKSSPNPWTYENVTNLTTEGDLLRITQNDKENEWFPLMEVFRIVELDRQEISA
jgi:hypothetical protein